MSIIIKPELKETVNEAFSKLLRSLGVYGLAGFDFAESLNNGISVPLETSEAITYYVETTGSDTNDGSQASPFKTIQKAIDMVPKRVKHPVNINVGAGNFKGAYINGFTFGTINTAGAYLRIVGTLGTWTPATGPATGTFTSANKGATSTWATGTLTGAGWTVNDLRGKLVEITGGSGVGTFAVVADNTADTITFAGALTVDINATSTFAIRTWLSVIDSPVYNPYYPTGQIGSTTYGFLLHNNPRFNLLDIEISAFKYSSIYGAVYSPSSTVTLTDSYFAVTGVVVQGASVPGYPVTVRRCSVSLAANNTLINGATIYAYSNVIVGGATAMAPSSSAGCSYAYSNGNKYLNLTSSALNAFTSCKVFSTYDKFVGCTIAISSSYFAYIAITQSDFSSCTTVLKAASNSYILAGASTGTSNTTVIQAESGATVFVPAACNIAGTTEISLDGVAKTFAEMRAASPKYLVNATTGTRVWGD